MVEGWGVELDQCGASGDLENTPEITASCLSHFYVTSKGAK
jgi:hypothetical protein